MANILKMDLITTIRRLKSQGWSKRRIARELQVDRQTVRRYLRKSSDLAFGSGGPTAEPAQNHPLSTPGSQASPGGSEGTVRSGRPSQCEAYAEPIATKLEMGLTAQRIYQDLVGEAGFSGSYQAVKRWVQKLRARAPGRVYRLEVQPGEEAQVDFGRGVPIVGEANRSRRPWIFRVVLSYSRKAYSEAVWRQNTETFVRALENAFRHFGGVPKTLNLDNLKAAVLRADWYEPELNPKLESFCAHYGTALLPCRPYHPQHKGKIERAIGYVKDNALKGRTFQSLAQLNEFLAHWERTVADQRIHGTVRQQVASLFAQEQKALLPLPPDLFPCFSEAQRTVHGDSYVEVDRAYYAAPTEYLRRTLWARWDNRSVRLFNTRWEQLALHPKLCPGQFTKPLGIGGGQGSLEQNLAYWIKRASELGQPCAAWAQGLVEQRGPAALRTLMGLVDLRHKHSFATINRACACALSHRAWRLRDLRQLLIKPTVQTHFAFAQNHPLIRNLAEYGLFIKTQNHE
jgi:transposase